jgi:BarA-like signal transduction histidine kinase
MELMMNVLDDVLAIVELADAVMQFFQREAVKRALAQGKRVGQATILVMALVTVVLFCFVWCGVKALYRAWVGALPGAIAAFKEGYVGIEVVAQAEPLFLAPAVATEAVVAAAVATEAVVVELPAKSLSLSQQLRQQCQAAGIQWRNANGQGKHLTVKQMQAALAGGEC